MTRRLLAGMAIVALASLGTTGAFAADSGPSVAVIVEAQSVDAASNAVTAVGGHVDMNLPLVGGVAAHVNGTALGMLQADAAVRVTPDVELHPTSLSFAGSAVDTQIAALDPGRDLAADAATGVGVALLDTGVADTPDLSGSHLVRSPDFSGEHDGIDHYGHGTFMAGLIAGDGSASRTASTRHIGIAPGATIVSVKVAGADGTTTMSRVIAGMGWVVTHRDAYNIGVLNLSFGVDLPMPWIADPLAAAAEAAWSSGITVVAAAGNEGAGNVTSPGSDPFVITVGATDTGATAATNDDSVPTWSGIQHTHGFDKPDVVAPGVSVISLRAPGSTIDREHPEGRFGTDYFRGTGTSMSTALVSGAAAILLSHHGNATPDDVKGALVDGATTLAGGAHAVDLWNADHAVAHESWWQHFHVSFDGLGRGMHDGMPWTASRWTNDDWAASRWTASRWTATRWTATRWTELDWSASRWTAEAFTASRWTATRWTAEAWQSQSWG